ncbi:MAG: beta-lactamase [Rhodopila sp.]|jgi:glyoxylase-like metal-dependent hydrolase (beta-lactamase superfamily II)|nr:beta-lactamase [Rhodopila sp.]
MKTLLTEQAPGYYRHRMGDIVVTALNDGSLAKPAEILSGIDPAGAAAILRAEFRPETPVITVNAFLVQTPDLTVLIDAGCGTKMGPTVGRMAANLHAAGLDPAEIDLVLLTHPDHVNGLLTADGSPAFGHARIMAHAADAAFFLSEAAAARAPEPAKPVFAMARAALAPYGERFSTCEGGEVAPGITAVPLPGHSPGHCGFRVVGAGQSLLIWGDIVHVPDLQCRRPEVGLVFDDDPTLAAATRRQALTAAAEARELVAGMHLLFPGFAHVTAEGGAFRSVPLMWSALGAHHG